VAKIKLFLTVEGILQQLGSPNTGGGIWASGGIPMAMCGNRFSLCWYAVVAYIIEGSH